MALRRKLGKWLALSLLVAALGLLVACGSFQSETTVFGIEITCIDSATMLPTGRAGLIRHKNQLTQAGQAQQFYNAESDVNLWTGSLAHAYTSMSCAAAPDSNTKNEGSR